MKPLKNSKSTKNSTNSNTKLSKCTSKKSTLLEKKLNKNGTNLKLTTKIKFKFLKKGSTTSKSIIQVIVESRLVILNLTV